jgi:HAD superfamily hydrolase (TIGR01484 family)
VSYCQVSGNTRFVTLKWNIEMKPFQAFSKTGKRNIRFILTDIDDTLTTNGRLPAVAFTAMERLRKADRKVIPITGRPAGWCDHIARMWPVDAVVGENGAFFFRYDDGLRKMQRRYYRSDKQRASDRDQLEKLKSDILKQVPGCRVSADQAYREADLAIDYCEDIPALSMPDVDEIVNCFEKAGAQAKVSSIHVNGWFGDYDKLTMTEILFEEIFKEKLDDIKSEVIFVGDSPNDAPMFAYFPNSVGVANVLKFEDRLTSKPAWVTREKGGHGFAEMVGVLLGG